MSSARSLRAGAPALAVVLCAMGTDPAHGASQSIVRWKPSDGGNGHWYRAVQFGPGVTWDQAASVAQQQGGYLATLTSSAENSFAFDLVNDNRFWRMGATTPFPKYEGPWIGGMQSTNAATAASGWGWVTGETFTYSAWGYMQPNDAAGNASQDRLQFWSSNSIAPTWQDVQGSYAAPSFIIEYDTMPSGARDRVERLFGALRDAASGRRQPVESTRRHHMSPSIDGSAGGFVAPGGDHDPGHVVPLPAPGMAGVLAIGASYAARRRRAR